MHLRSVYIDGEDHLARHLPLWKMGENIGVGLTDQQKICRHIVGTEYIFDYHDLEIMIDTVFFFFRRTWAC